MTSSLVRYCLFLSLARLLLVLPGIATLLVGHIGLPFGSGYDCADAVAFAMSRRDLFMFLS